jgi:hypothetical protein
MLGHFSRPAALLAACALAVAAPTAQAEPPKQPLVRRVYQVADLVVPRPDMVVVTDRHEAKAEPEPKSQPTREDKLIHLIEQTIAPQSWSGSGGEGTLDYHPLTGALVINQTMDVQEQVADILSTLRKLQGQEVALEVRILSVPEETFARARVEVDSSAGPWRPKALLLNDTQVRRLLEVAQGDHHTTVEQAPRVTLFSGQDATVDLTRSEPTLPAGIILQPACLRTGFRLMVRPAVSADRRFVKVGLRVERAELTDQQPTPSQPELIQNSCTLTACVPDGGTVVLGGFKKVCVAQKECAPPVLSDIPYLNRLFTNVRPCRESQAVYVLVTPRIVRTEEQEETKPATCRPAGECRQLPAATVPCPPCATTAKAKECVQEPCIPQVERETRTKDVLVDLLRAYERACAEGDVMAARKLARAALELDPTCFSRKW